MKARYGHFDLVAPIYDLVFGRAHHQALIAHTAAGPGDLVLDIGGGTGRVAEALRAAGAQVVVVDPSPAMLMRARGKGLPAVRALAEALPLPDGSVDRAIVVDAFHHFADQPAAARELVRVLRPGGRLVVEEPDIRRLAVKGIALAERLALMQSRFRSPAELERLFAAAGARTRSVTPHQISVHAVLTK